MSLILLRLLAGAIDAAVIGFGLLAAFFTVIELETNSPAGYWLVTAVTTAPFLYYTLLDSRIGEGRTLGKLLLGLSVRSTDLQFLPLHQSVLRTAFRVALPIVGSYAAMALLRNSAVLAIALLLITIVAFPVSVILGRGGTGVHDLAARSVVVRNNRTKLERPSRISVYLIAVLAVSGALSFPASVAITKLSWGTQHAPRTSADQELDRDYRPVIEAIKNGPDRTESRLFIENVEITSEVDPLPTHFDRSPTVVPPDLLSLMRQGIALFTLDIQLTSRGYNSPVVVGSLISRVETILGQNVFLPGNWDGCVWLRLSVERAFGPVTVKRATRELLVFRLDSTKHLRVDLIEPEEINYFNIEISNTSITTSM